MHFDLKRTTRSYTLFKHTALKRLGLCVIPWCFGLTINLPVVADSTIQLELLQKIEQQFGAPARSRVIDWQHLIDSGQAWTDQQKLVNVNNFFNRTLQFKTDASLWQIPDYWATPLESLVRAAGDCEDYAIAKYFTLKSLGIAEDKMRITYVKALTLNQAHMVLTYFASPRSVPLVLDNLVSAIHPATDRTDLIPVYSFNGTGLWLAKVRGTGQQVSGADRLSRWTSLKQRMARNAL